MAKKNQITKLDIIRWIAILPLTILAIIVFTNVFTNSLYIMLPRLFSEETVSNIIGIFDAISLPLLITACGYYISPKFKFKSTLFLILAFLLLQAWNLLYTEYARSNPFIPFFVMSYLCGIFLVYKFGKK